MSDSDEKRFFVLAMTGILALGAVAVVLNGQCQKTVQDCIKAGQPVHECRRVGQ